MRSRYDEDPDERRMPGWAKVLIWGGSSVVILTMLTMIQMSIDRPKVPPHHNPITREADQTVTAYQEQGLIRKFEVFDGGEGADVTLSPAFYLLEYDQRNAVLASLSEIAKDITGGGYLRLLDPYTNRKVGFYLDGHLELK
jgi:hypothetical protein